MKQYLILTTLLFISLVNAFPLQILPNGTLIEADYNVGTQVDIILFNNSLYIIEANLTPINMTYQNITYQDINYYNDTYVNQTCFNCTNYYNVTNYYNDTNFSLYNQSYIDNNFVTNSIFDNFKSNLNYATKEELNSSLSFINAINNLDESHTHTWTGIIIFIIFLIQSGTIIYIIYKVREEE